MKDTFGCTKLEFHESLEHVLKMEIVVISPNIGPIELWVTFLAASHSSI